MTATQRHIMFASPSYDGRLGFGFAAAMLDSIGELHRRGWSWSQCMLGGCSLIELARQEIVATFLATPSATHLVMADSDIGWRADDLVRLIEYDEPLVFGVAKKRMSDQYCVRYLPGENADTVVPADARGLIEVEAAGGGFGVIRRDALERMCEAYPELAYDAVDGSKIYALYLLDIAEGSLFGEDYAFCRRWRSIGGRVLVDPEVWLRHSHGTAHVEGRLGDILPAIRARRAQHLADSVWVLPSRGRPKQLGRFATAYRETGATAPVVVRLDRDDACLEAYRALDLPRAWTVRTGPRRDRPRLDAIDEVFATHPHASCYGLLADDVVPRTYEWDRVLAMASGRDRVAYGDDLLQRSALATHPVIGGDLVRRVGWITLPDVEHAFADTAWHVLAQAAKRLVFLPEVRLEHMHPLAGKAEEDATYRFREHFATDQERFLKWSETELPTVVARLAADTED